MGKSQPPHLWGVHCCFGCFPDGPRVYHQVLWVAENLVRIQATARDSEANSMIALILAGHDSTNMRKLHPQDDLLLL